MSGTLSCPPVAPNPAHGEALYKPPPHIPRPSTSGNNQRISIMHSTQTAKPTHGLVVTEEEINRRVRNFVFSFQWDASISTDCTSCWGWIFQTARRRARQVWICWSATTYKFAWSRYLEPWREGSYWTTSARGRWTAAEIGWFRTENVRPSFLLESSLELRTCSQTGSSDLRLITEMSPVSKKRTGRAYVALARAQTEKYDDAFNSSRGIHP